MTALADLGRKLDTVAGALAAIVGSHSDLLGHVAEAEARRSHDAREVAQRLGALERQVLSDRQAPPPPVDPLDPFPARSVPADLENLRSDLALGLDVLAQVAESVQNLERRAEDESTAPPEPTADAHPEVTERIEELGKGLMLHTDLALAGALRRDRPPARRAPGHALRRRRRSGQRRGVRSRGRHGAAQRPGPASSSGSMPSSTTSADSSRPWRH